MKLGRWANFGISARLLVITFLPVVSFFGFVAANNYRASFGEALANLGDECWLIVTTLAESSDYAVTTGNFDEVSRTINGLIAAGPNVHSVELHDTNGKPLLLVTRNGNRDAGDYSCAAPIHRKAVAIDAFDGAQGPHVSNAGDSAVLEDKGVIGRVRVILTTQNAENKQNQRFLQQLYGALIALMVTGLFGYGLSRRLTRPLLASITAIRGIRGGAQALQIPVTEGGEIGDLQESINAMSKSLAEATEVLESRILERTRQLEESRDRVVKADAEKRQLIQRMDHLLEDERRNIAREVHDDLNATVIAVRLNAERIIQLTRNAECQPVLTEIAAKAEEVRTLALGLYSAGRNLVRRLRPEVMELLGLQGAIEEMVRQYNQTHPTCRFALNVAGEIKEMGSDLSMAAYRIVQEALSNIVKHAHATEAIITMAMSDDHRTFRISIADNGKGIDESHPSKSPKVGLIGMHERVYAFNGQIEIRSGIGKGTEIIVAFPVS